MQNCDTHTQKKKNGAQTLTHAALRMSKNEGKNLPQVKMLDRSLQFCCDVENKPAE